MAKETKVKDIDITKSGPMTFRDLQEANQEPYTSLSPEFQSFSVNVGANTAPTSLYDARAHGEQMVASSLERTATPWGSSMFDESTATEAQFQELGDIRAENQPWYAKIGAGLAKGTLLAGTTFLDGTVGLVLGAGTAISEGRWSGLWDNEFSRTMQSMNEFYEEVLPNYYTRAEQEQPWYENIFTANFLGDKFIKNLGFTVGAFYSSGVTAAGLKATKLPQLIGTITKASKAPAIVTSAVGATISAVNEGRIEALNNSKDWFELHKSQLDDKFRERISSIEAEYKANAGRELVPTGIEGQDYIDPAYVKYQEALAREQEAYNAAIGKLNEDRLKMGNADLLMNIPILTASNIIQFGKLYANGFKTARKATNIVGRAGEYAAGTTKLGSAMAITRGALSEGTEEISQKAASVISGNYYSTDVNNFYKSKTDPEASQETLSWVKSFAQGINETVNDGSSWEEFFIGTLTGALGMPSFRSARNKDGGFQSPITFEGGAVNEWKEYNQKRARESEIANYMNGRVNSPEFKNYYQGLIRHNKYQNDMNRAAEEGNEFDFKNAEHAQLISDISMFDNAGRMEDLITLIDAAFDTSDENLASIVENTTATLEDGSKVGPFVDKNGNPMYATPEGKQEMIEKLKQNHNEMTNTINEYLKIKDNIDIRTGQQLSDSQLEELTWMKSQLNNWSERAVSMSGEVKSAIGNVIGNLDSLLRFNIQVRDFEDQTNAGVSDTYLQADKNIKAIEGAINTLNMVRGQDDKTLAHTLATNPKFVDGLIKEINEVDESVLSTDEKKDIVSKLNDIVKLGNASETYNAKLKEYLENPQKQVEDHARADEQAVQQEAKKKSDDLKTSLNAAQNLRDFRAVVDNNIDDIKSLNSTLEELESEGSEMAKNYRETSQYNNEVRRVINSSDAEPQVKQDAIKLLQDQFSNSENLEQLANPNSIYINNENAFDEASEGDVELSATRFQEAQYELQRAMSQVNNDNKFKDRFSPEYKKPVEKREGPVRGDNRSTTGDSGTPTLPTVKVSTSPTTGEGPTGNITKEEIIEENKKFNEEDTPQNPKKGEIKQYYRPAIPELHIEASKEGDFRPFNVVAMEKSGLDFSEIYNYLKEARAFEYVNEGNLVSKDGEPVELGFMIDPAFEEKVAGKPWHTKPTIFIIDKRNNQVVGSLDEGGSVANFEGLAGLEERVRAEYQNRQSSSTKRPSYSISKEQADELVRKREEILRANKELHNHPNIYRISEIMHEYFGYGTVSDRVIDEFNNLVKNTPFSSLAIPTIERIDTNSRFIATPTTKVSKIMVGKIPFNNEERSLANIPNVSSESREPIFGIIKNGALITNITNDKFSDSDIIKPMDMSKEGRLYLFIPNAAGKYSPAAVRVKHFNKEEFNLDDITVSSTIIGENIKNAITKLAESVSQDDVSLAMQDLAQDLFVQDIMVSHFTASAGEGIVISRKVRKADGSYEFININGEEHIKEEKYSIYFNTSKKQAEINGFLVDASIGMKSHPELYGVPKDTGEIVKEIINILVGFNLPLQVSTGKINKGSYNANLINSNILTSNIENAVVIGNWFTTDYFDSKGNLQPANNPASVTQPREDRKKTPVGGTNSVITGTKITSIFTNNSYYIDLSTNTIKSENGEVIAITDSNRILLDLAWAQEFYGDKTIGINMVNNKVITPEGKVLDRTKQAYLEGTEAQAVKDTIAARKKPETKLPEEIQGTPATPSAPVTPSTIGGDQTTSPIFNTSLELQNYNEALSDNHSFQDSNEKVGYYEIEGRLYKGYLLPITTIEGIKVHVTKTPNITKGFGKTAEHVASNTYYAVFPNGRVWKAGKDDGRTHSEMVDYITKALSGNPQRVKDMTNEKTLLFDPTSTKTNISSNNTEAMQASFVTQKEKAVNPTDDEFEDDDILGMLRKVSGNEATIWNKEQELEWLNKVLPNIRAEHRLKVVNGLIKVGKKGIQAWGQFDKGIITLSDIAAEGTTYHEAFHVVFNLLLDNNERQALYDEAKKLYGEKDNLSLEEDMAEGFREYVMTRQNRGLGRKILDFFKELFIKVTNWNNFRPSLLSYYRRINAGEYAKSEFIVPSISESRAREVQYSSFGVLSTEVQNNLLKKGWTEEQFNSISQVERDHAIKCIAF